MECYHREEDEDGESNDLLNNLELHECKRPAVVDKSETIGRYLHAVLEKGNAPREEDDEDERGRMGKDIHILQLEVTIPCQSHEDIRCN